MEKNTLEKEKGEKNTIEKCHIREKTEYYILLDCTMVRNAEEFS